MSEKRIISGIPVDGTTYGPGMEDELAEKLDAKQITYLTEQGAIEGFTKKEESDSKTSSKK
jgi:hypothetical protein